MGELYKVSGVRFIYWKKNFVMVLLFWCDI